MDAIADKRAQTQVIRRLVYIQPDPGPPLRLSAPRKTKAKQGTDDAPEWLPSLWTALGSVKGSHPILRDLVRLRDLNLRIEEVSAISSAQMAQVLAILNSAAGGTADRKAWDEMTFDELKILAGDLNREAEKLIGAYYATYCRLKLEAAGSALADEISKLFSYPPDRRRPCFGGVERLQTDLAWKDNVIFSEYFHGDNGAGLGASHQTGWTGTVGDLIRRRYSNVLAIRELQPTADHRAMTSPRNGAIEVGDSQF